MATDNQTLLTIGTVSEQTGVTVSTLRFYEQEGLFLHDVIRDNAQRRLFSPDEVDWVLVCKKLRSSGMPLPKIREYVTLVRAGRHTQQQRLDLLREHQQAVAAQVADLQDALGIIDAKVRFYADHVGDTTVRDDVWLDTVCEASALSERSMTSTAA